MPAREANPFVVAGALRREDMIDRDREAAELLSLAQGGQPFRVVGPRRYGKTSLLSRVLDDAETAGMATALVDLEGVLSSRASCRGCSRCPRRSTSARASAA
ncbi:MAG: AAA-like domain-containing protein [Thermoleophilaceae bacterium]